MKTTGKTIKTSKENKAAIRGLSTRERELFTILRNAMMEIFPFEDSKKEKFYDDTIFLSECFGLIAAKGINEYIEREIQQIRREYDDKIETVERIRIALTTLGIII